MARIWKRADRDSWTVDYRDAHGHRRRLAADTREQAEQLLAEKVRESRQAAPPVDNPEITLGAYADPWLGQVAINLAPRTLASYRENFDRYIRPALGHFKLRALHRGHIKSLLGQKRQEGLSKNSVRLIRATLSVMLGDAVDDGFLVANPAQGVTRRGRRGADTLTSGDRQRSIRPLSIEELSGLLSTARAHAAKELGTYTSRRDALLYFTLADTGLRPGEALALRWEDFDEATGTVNVERAVSLGAVKPTKTEERRTVDLTPRLVVALGDWQAAIEMDALDRGIQPSPWVFPADSGELLDVKPVSRRFRALLRRAKLPRHRLYDLRHTYATHLLAEGAPITYVAAQLGHARPTTTLAHYAHWLPRGDRQWVERLDRARGAALGTRSWHQRGREAIDASDVSESIGEPSRDRTEDPLIKSQVLYQLS